MEELVQALSRFRESSPDLSTILEDDPFGTLQEAGEKWACWSLRHLRGDHLCAAMQIAVAISEFVTVEWEVRHGSK